MKLTISDNNKNIAIERASKTSLSTIVNDFIRLLTAYGFSNKEILKVIKKRDKYVNDLEEYIYDLEATVAHYKKHKDSVFKLHENTK